jgi:hypothetical protein
LVGWLVAWIGGWMCNLLLLFCPGIDVCGNALINPLNRKLMEIMMLRKIASKTKERDCRKRELVRSRDKKIQTQLQFLIAFQFKTL